MISPMMNLKTMIKKYDDAVHYMFGSQLITTTAMMLLDGVSTANQMTEILIKFAEMRYGGRILCDVVRNESDVTELSVKLELQARVLYDKYEKLYILYNNIDVEHIDDILYNRLKIKTGQETDNGSAELSGTDSTSTTGNVTTDTDKKAYDTTIYNDTSVEVDTNTMDTDITYGKKNTSANIHGYNVTEKGFTNINLVNGIDQLARMISSKNFHLFEKWFEELINGITIPIYVW